MLLAIDVGNTNTVIGLYPTHGDSAVIDHWRAATNTSHTSDEWLMIVRQFLSWRDVDISKVQGVVVASVVPAVTQSLTRMCKRVGVVPLIVNWQTDTGMPLLLDEPSEVGADRIANGVAAMQRTDGPVIVVDMGTATTLDVVSGAGEYLGGVILPGIDLSLNALFDRAAALRRIELFAPEKVVGSSTAGAMRTGATYGFACQIDGLCELVEAEIGKCTVISTGGLGGTIATLSKKIESHEPWLTLDGLRLIHQRNAH